MDIDHILATFNRHQVDYLLIGGVNFLLRHTPVLTYDIDLWIDDTAENRRRCETALGELRAEWGMTDSDWGPVVAKRPGWMDNRSVLCLTSPSGAIDIFRSVAGLSSWSACQGRAEQSRTASGTAFLGLTDADMLDCQLALPEGQRNEARVHYLQNAQKRC
jgi:hypothetical protein